MLFNILYNLPGHCTQYQQNNEHTVGVEVVKKAAKVINSVVWQTCVNHKTGQTDTITLWQVKQAI